MTTLGRLVSRPWSDPRADIPGDLQNFVRKVRRESDLMLRLAGLGKNTWGYIVQNLKVPHYIAINEAAHAALFAYPFQGRIGVFGFTISAYPALQDNQILITPLPSDRWIRCRRFPWRSFGKVARYDETKPNPP